MRYALLAACACALVFAGNILLFAKGTHARSASYHVMESPRIQQESGDVEILHNRLVRIGIIDSGYRADAVSDEQKLKICDHGSVDYLSNRAIVSYTEPHGTIVGSLIGEALQGVNYCAVIYQVDTPGGISDDAVRRALRAARSEHLFAVNISLAGWQFSMDDRFSLYELGRDGTAIFVAAGNDHKNLDEVCNTYPACYRGPNLYVIGATDDDAPMFKAAYSNFGSKVYAWYPGSAEFEGDKVTGTSFAAPRALADYVRAFAKRVSQ